MLQSNSIIAPPGGWGLQKPPCGIGIDRSHSLTRELVALWPLNEGSGTIVNDVAGGRTGRNTNPFVTWQPGNAGVGLRGVSGSSSGCIAFLPLWTSGTTFSLAVLAKAESSAGVYQALVEDNTANGFGLYLYAGKMRWYESSGNYDSQSAVAGVNKWCLYGFSAQNGAGVFWFNGKSWGTATVVSHTYTRLLSDPYSETLFGSSSFVGIWSRALRADEWQNLSDRPFDMFATGLPLGVSPPGRSLVDGSLASGPQLIGK